ncbi:MAG: transporter substrate-binding domain-containing protein, partial [Campylobacteraceae bacterium]|nr:transporter substrate-binding domain-containing protein [Campylobacteraceae bacterium]
MNKLNKIILCLLFTSFLSAFTSWAQTLQIEQKSYLFLCSEWPPYEYMSKNKKPIGFSVEVLEEMSKVLNIKSEIKFYPWARAYSLALNTKDVAVFTMARTKVREKIFKWVGPISDREIYMWKLKKKE